MKADSYKICDNVYWVGVLDWDIRNYHGYSLTGTTYNCYLVFGDEKVALIDNVYPGKSAQFWGRIKDAFEKEGREFKIDVMIQNHIEKDHSGSLVEVLKKFPDIEVYLSKKADSGIKKHYHELADCEFNVVGTGDEVSLGDKTLAFVNAPMLHWSDSMFTMLMEDGILFSNDAFGQHICLSDRLDVDVNPEILEKITQKYYANLITPMSPIVRRKMAELVDLGLVEKTKIIAPCHGQIWTKPETVLELYTKWANGVCKDKITLIYDTMHYSTQSMAYAIAEGIMSEDVEVKMFFMHEDDKSDVVAEVLDSKAIFVGSPTMMNKAFPGIGDVMYYLDCLSFDKTTYKKKAIAFGSKGWSGGANKKIKTDLETAGFEVIDEKDLIFVPTEDELEECYELGKNVAKMIKSE
ncbi:MAG: FprA family A-type flavoprotein [archaeon]|nr:FprA family A-type flavoprotein [archaeon]